MLNLEGRQIINTSASGVARMYRIYIDLIQKLTDMTRHAVERSLNHTLACTTSLKVYLVGIIGAAVSL